MDGSVKQKSNKETSALNNTLSLTHYIYIYTEYSI